VLDEIRQAASRQRQARTLRALMIGSKRLLSQPGEINGMAVAHELVERLDDLEAEELDGYFDYLARELSPDPALVLRLAQAYADAPGAAPLIALTQAVEPPRQELLRRLNRAPGGTAAILRLRRPAAPAAAQARTAGARVRPAAPAELVVQPGLPEAAPGRLELAGAAARAD
jgi:malonyl-CoA decarboxylase